MTEGRNETVPYLGSWNPKSTKKKHRRRKKMAAEDAYLRTVDWTLDALGCDRISVAVIVCSLPPALFWNRHKDTHTQKKTQTDAQTRPPRP